MQNMNGNISIAQNLTVGIPIRVDSEERRANVSTIINYLNELRCHIIVLEADAHEKMKKQSLAGDIDYLFVKDTDQVFHRTRYINQILKMAQTEMVAIWDTDVLVDYRQILEALQLIRNGATTSYPYDGRFVMLSKQLSTQTRNRIDFDYLKSLKLKSFLGRKLCGGSYIVHRQRYLLCGGENEKFTGWGPEDAERLHRVTILGHKALHISSGELFHLYHPRGANSTYASKDNARELREEFVRVCCMSPTELKAYISR